MSDASAATNDGGKPASRKAGWYLVAVIAIVAAVAAVQFFGAVGGGEPGFGGYRFESALENLATDPLDHGARVELARFYLHRGTEILKRDRSIDDIVTDSELVSVFGDKLAEWEALGEDVAVLRKLLKSDFAAFHARYAQKQGEIARGMFERSIIEYRRAIALGANLSAKNEYHLGTAYYQLGPEGYPGASKYLSRAVEAGLVSTRALTFLGNVAMARGDLGSGVELYRRAIELSPDDPVLAFNLALALKEDSQIDMAVRFFRMTIDLYGDREDLAEDELSIILQSHLALGWCLLKAGEYVEAEKEFEAVLAGQPESVEGHYWLGVAYERQRRYEAARAHWQKVKDLKPGFRDVGERLETLGRQIRDRAR